METIVITTQEDYAILKLQRGKANPINLQMLEELGEAFEELEKDDAVRGVVLAGNPGVFSAGLDVVELYRYDETQFAHFWQTFMRVTRQIIGFRKALVAAVTGHSPAGGCVLALCCDYRVMAEGPYMIGLNEIGVGLVLPGPVAELMVHAIGRPKTYQLALDAALLTAEQAQQAGFINEICPVDQVVTRATEKLKRWLVYNDNAWRLTKYYLRRELRDAFEGDFDALYADAVQHWWSPECRVAIGRLISLLGK